MAQEPHQIPSVEWLPLYLGVMMHSQLVPHLLSHMRIGDIQTLTEVGRILGDLIEQKAIDSCPAKRPLAPEPAPKQQCERGISCSRVSAGVVHEKKTSEMLLPLEWPICN